MFLQIWQIILAIIVIFIFGVGMGRMWGQGKAWKDMDKQEQPKELFHNMECMIGNVLYKTEGSTVLAVQKGNGFVDEPFEWYLMKTSNRRYFEQHHHGYDTGQEDSLFSRTKEEAMRSYNACEDKKVSFEEAFNEQIIEA